MRLDGIEHAHCSAPTHCTAKQGMNGGGRRHQNCGKAEKQDKWPFTLDINDPSITAAESLGLKTAPQETDWVPSFEKRNGGKHNDRIDLSQVMAARGPANQGADEMCWGKRRCQPRPCPTAFMPRPLKTLRSQARAEGMLRGMERRDTEGAQYHSAPGAGGAGTLWGSHAILL